MPWLKLDSRIDESITFGGPPSEWMVKNLKEDFVLSDVKIGSW